MVTIIPREGDAPPEPRWSVDECWDHYPNHPTIFVRTCSPDPLLTHDGETSQACRTCGCGRAGAHVTGCTAGHGPPRKATTGETACLLVDGICDELVKKHGVPADTLAAVRAWNRARWPWPDVTIPDFRAGDRPAIPGRPDLVNSS